MNSIDNELATLHARIAQLEELKKTPPIKPLEVIRDETKDRLNKKYSNHPAALVAKCCDGRALEMLESIIESLNLVHIRLDNLEKGGKHTKYSDPFAKPCVLASI